jgi:phosphoglycolate phosphatase
VAINGMRADYGWDPLAIEQVIAMVGEGAQVLVASALGMHSSDETRPESVSQALRRFYRHYGQVCLENTRPYPGIEGMLTDLAERYPLAIYANKPERFVRKILNGLQLGRFFPELLGGDTLPTRKPEPPGVRLLAERLGVPVTATMLVGDSRIDAATARSAGCRFAFAEWGFAENEEREEIRALFRPEIKAANPGQLARRLLEL